MKRRAAMRHEKICLVEGCERPFLAKGYCKMHYARMWGMVIPSYASSPNLRCVPLTDAADALSRRVTVLCTMNVCVDTAALNRAGLKHALSKGAAGSTMQRVTATCTTTVSVIEA